MTASEIAKERVAQELVNFLLPGEVVPSEVVISVYYPNSVATLRLGGDRLQRVTRDIIDGIQSERI